jgi:hypothetical protein
MSVVLKEEAKAESNTLFELSAGDSDGISGIHSSARCQSKVAYQHDLGFTDQIFCSTEDSCPS